MRILRKHKAQLFRKTIKGYYTEDGEWVEGENIIPSDLLCCIQPITTLSKKLDLPEGIREKDSRVVWTHTELKVSSEITGEESDIIRYKDLDFEVYDIGDWDGAGRIKAYEAIIIRKDKL